MSCTAVFILGAESVRHHGGNPQPHSLPPCLLAARVLSYCRIITIHSSGILHLNPIGILGGRYRKGFPACSGNESRRDLILSSNPWYDGACSLLPGCQLTRSTRSYLLLTGTGISEIGHCHVWRVKVENRLPGASGSAPPFIS